MKTDASCDEYSILSWLHFNFVVVALFDFVVVILICVI